MKSRILVVDDEKAIRLFLKSALEHSGYQVDTAVDFESAIEKLHEGGIDLVLSDIILGGKTGIDILQEVKNMGINCPVVLITGAPSVSTASDAVRLGAFDYISKPFGTEHILKVTATALRHKELADKLSESRKTLDAIFRSVTDAIITVDDKLRILQLNEAAYGLCGIGAETVGGSFERQTSFCSGSCMEAIKKTLNSKVPVNNHNVECKFGEDPVRVINLSTFPLRYEGDTVSGAVLVMKDETRLYELERDLKERQNFHNLVGKSSAMQEVYSLVERLADVESTVLILGESGTGKELVAEALHYGGRRSSGPIVKVNCSALSEHLLESELFGHVKGAFTGAINDKPGKFEQASRGTIFLDEIGDISPQVQVKLLRVLQSFEVERVGDTRTRKVDVRIVAATNRDLQEWVRQEKFREDLFYRLRVVEILLPPLRERKEDIPLLVDYFLVKMSRKLHKRIESVSGDVMRIFMEHGWPGNVRELENVLEYAGVLAKGSVIMPENLPPEYASSSELAAASISSKNTVNVSERDAIIRALDACGWKKAAAARMLGISRMTIYRKIDEYGIRPQ
jgi:PAS domain S-box-containing protein